MYFKRLELVGFKSFCDKTILNFEPGVTAVVGPNGTGKSNIFDSIRWVLGEQSAKSLRGCEMQDVIFNGTDLKEPVGMAEVSLVFDNASRFFDLDHPEICITRRLFRSGESEYLLNKNPVRLKDVLDILMGTGIGSESYSIVAQGKIDLILSSRPEERRLVFDEASGITKYKAQKRETTRKLEETQQNLLRIDDIISEVKRQISSLQRQANKARRYKEVFEELKSKETNLAAFEKERLVQQRNEIIKQLKDLESSEAGLFNKIAEEQSRIANRQNELKAMEESMMAARNQILNLENLIVRHNEHAAFNTQRIIELQANKGFLESQIAQVENNLVSDQRKLNNLKEEFLAISKNIEVKSLLLENKEAQINGLTGAIKQSIENISLTKKKILDLATRLAHSKNEASEFSAKKQIFLARKKRLEIEKIKVYEEKAISQASLESTKQETEALKKLVAGLNLKIAGVKEEAGREQASLGSLESEISNLEKQRFTLESHKEFLEKLKTKYDDIGESMKATIYLDKVPSESMGGLVVKINGQLDLSAQDKLDFGLEALKVTGEAKPIELNTQKIEDRLNRIEQNLAILRDNKIAKGQRIQELDTLSVGLQQELRNQEINLANKQTSLATVLEQFNKINEEEDIILAELQDVQQEIVALELNLTACENILSGLNREERQAEDLILREEDNIALKSRLREEVLVVITQTKTEIDSLNKSIISGEATIKILEDTYKQDQESLDSLRKQMQDALDKKESLAEEIKGCQRQIAGLSADIQSQKGLLKEIELKYNSAQQGASEVASSIEADRKELSALKERLHSLQMQGKDIDYRLSSLQERMLQAYKIDLGAHPEAAKGLDTSLASQEIQKLKETLDGYGTVNLVAIEEYDELKKRYDFLIQQQNDLLQAKESLHEAILKINRTTRQMFMQTFERIKEEFRNYFRLLFGGGDAQLFLVDEQDPLESGIEIICRPPGKKLQNVLLLSGGEKSMSAIALIFAIFKVKPSPFCILDEIDAALDEANVDRFAKILQEFTSSSQFIVITHNKKTIANADIMYGITMEESGVSKIVSVKFAKDAEQEEQDREPNLAVAEPV